MTIPERIGREFDNLFIGFYENYCYLKDDFQSFHEEIRSFIRAELGKRRERILQSRSVLKALGVPIIKKESTPETFSVPKPKLRRKIQLSCETTHGFEPEPTLSEEVYEDILKIIDDVGKNFERMPSVYSAKHEEDLRDHILMVLDPNFQLGSATGETFNKSGKTDIQLRYDSSVVFIAECKFWDGIKAFFAGIDQLLGYLTWRDSKTAFIAFVGAVSISKVIDTVKEKIQEHPNYISDRGQSSENRLNYNFSLPSDENKEIQISIQFYHLP
jgi:hypothetical protein